MIKFATTQQAAMPPATAVPASPRTAQRLPLLAMTVPLLLLLGYSLAGAVKQVTAPSRLDPHFAVSEEEAARRAQQFFSQCLGGPVEALSQSAHIAYSLPARAPICEWSVVCQTRVGQYQVRINGRDGRLYGVNRLSLQDQEAGSGGNSSSVLEAGLRLPLALPASPQELSQAVEVQRLEARALHYLTLAGVAVTRINSAPVEVRVAWDAWRTNARVLVFAYRWKDEERKGEGRKSASLTVTVSARDGSLDSLYNPAFFH